MAVPEAADNWPNIADRGIAQHESPFDSSPRGRLLTAMPAVLAHGGFRDATVARVLERAGVGWEDFAREFEDLDGCFLATLDAGLECAALAAERAMNTVAHTADAETIFEAGLRGALAAASAHPELTRLCLVESPALGAKAVVQKQAGLQRFVRLMQERVRPAAGGAALPALPAEMVAGGIYEVLQRKARAGELDDLPKLIPELRQLWGPVIRSATG